MDLIERDCDRLLRAEILDFLAAELTPAFRRAGELMTSIFADFDLSVRWHKILFKRGWAAPTWPREYGGTGWDQGQYAIFLDEMAEAGAPPPFPLGVQMLGPVLIRYGTDEQRARYLPHILSGDDIWCQGYSEPGAGSDLASLSTRAVRDGERYVVNGSKIWTSFAHRANRMFCLVRTGTSGRPQDQISFLLIDLDIPGVTISEIRSIDGEVEQCQVFFEDAVVPAANLVGAEHEGWAIAKFLLDHERGGYSYHAAAKRQLRMVRKLPRDAGDLSVPVLADCEIDTLALQYMEYRIRSGGARDGTPSVYYSLAKVAGNELGQRLDSLALALRGAYGALQQNMALSPGYNGTLIGPDRDIAAMNRYLNNRASTIYGGSSQIQRNIMARQLLRLGGDMPL